MSPSVLSRGDLRRLTETYHGYWYYTAGMAFGFFEDPDDARKVGIMINAIVGQVTVVGCQIIVTF